MTGNMLRAVSGHLVLELIKEVGVQFSLPESFENHKNHIAGQFPPIRNAAKKFFVERVDELIDDSIGLGDNSYKNRPFLTLCKNSTTGKSYHCIVPISAPAKHFLVIGHRVPLTHAIIY